MENEKSFIFNFCMIFFIIHFQVDGIEDIVRNYIIIIKNLKKNCLILEKLNKL